MDGRDEGTKRELTPWPPLTAGHRRRALLLPTFGLRGDK